MTARRSSTNSRKRAAATPLERFVALGEQVILDNGEPFTPEGWQRDVVADLLAGKPEVHLWVPEANGKTTLAALVAIHHLLVTPNPRVVVAAASELQARTLYTQAEGMVLSSPWLEDELAVRNGTLEIRLRRGFGGLKVIAADRLRAHGQINSLVILDEMHAHPGLGLYRVLAGKLTKRDGAQLFSISTAGEPDSEFEQMRTAMLTKSPVIEERGERCVRVEGPQHVAWCWALHPDDDIEDMDLVSQANPLSSMTPEVLQGKRDKPGWEEKHWRTYVCNIPTRDFVLRFLPAAEWESASCVEVIDDIPADVPVTLGIDWGFGDDATAAVPLWRDHEGSLLLGRALVIEPPRNGTQLDPEVVKERLVALHERNPIEIVAHDQGAHGGGHLMSPWLAQAFPDATIIPVTPQASADAAGHFLERLRAGELRHVGDATLTRHLLNAIRVPVKDDPEKFYVRRPKSSRHAPHLRATREIDAADAAVLAVWGTVGAPPLGDEPFMLWL